MLHYNKMEVNLQETLKFIQGVPQIVPQEWCLKCRICCRFPDSDTEKVQAPTWSPSEAQWAYEAGGEPSWFKKTDRSPSLLPRLHSCGEGCRCPAFKPESNTCSIYESRPLDCRLYPFVLTKDPSGAKVLLAMDTKCPYLEEHGEDSAVAAYSIELAGYLESPTGLAYLKTNPKIVGSAWPEFVNVAALSSITATVQPPLSPPHPALKPFTWADLPILEETLTWEARTRSSRPAGSSYTLAGLFGWSDLIRYWWTRLDDSFCLFAEQAGGLFMPIPPLGKVASRKVDRAAWEILVHVNQGAEVSRIEGIEPQETPRFLDNGFQLKPGEPEYLYRREDLVHLRGDRYRSQRWETNKFRRNFNYRIRPFLEGDLIPCLQLYTAWGIERQQSTSDSFPKALIRDGLFFHRRLMMSQKDLGLTGRVLEVEGQIRGYTFGAPVSDQVFCVFLEIADRSFPGAAQVLFQEFSRELEPFPWINAMGDSGLATLRRAKLSYRPYATLVTLVACSPLGPLVISNSTR